MQTDDLDEMFHILNTSRKLLANSGKDRIKYTFPTIVFKSYKLAYSYKEAAASDDKWDKKCDRIFKFCFQTINALLKAELPADIAFKLFLQGSIVIAEIAYENSENITYEFISQVTEFISRSR
jgi:vacuolar protein sorting-associated protein 35